MRIRVFTADPAGQYTHNLTTFLSAGLQDPVGDVLEQAEELVEEGDIVYLNDWYLLRQEGSWTSLSPMDERVQGLYPQAVRAES